MATLHNLAGYLYLNAWASMVNKVEMTLRTHHLPVHSLAPIPTASSINITARVSQVLVHKAPALTQQQLQQTIARETAHRVPKLKCTHRLQLAAKCLAAQARWMAEWDSGTKETVKRIPLLTVRPAAQAALNTAPQHACADVPVLAQVKGGPREKEEWGRRLKEVSTRSHNMLQCVPLVLL